MIPCCLVEFSKKAISCGDVVMHDRLLCESTVSSSRRVWFVLLSGQPTVDRAPDAILRFPPLRVVDAPLLELAQFLLHIHGRIGGLPLLHVFLVDREVFSGIQRDGACQFALRLGIRRRANLFRLCARSIPTTALWGITAVGTTTTLYRFFLYLFLCGHSDRVSGHVIGHRDRFSVTLFLWSSLSVAVGSLVPAVAFCLPLRIAALLQAPRPVIEQ